MEYLKSVLGIRVVYGNSEITGLPNYIPSLPLAN